MPRPMPAAGTTSSAAPAPAIATPEPAHDAVRASKPFSASRREVAMPAVLCAKWGATAAEFQCAPYGLVLALTPGMTEVRHRGARTGLLWLVVAAACASASCAKDISADVTGVLQQLSVASAPSGVGPAVWADVQRFYVTRSYAAAWTDDEKQS